MNRATPSRIRSPHRRAPQSGPAAGVCALLLILLAGCATAQPVRPSPIGAVIDAAIDRSPFDRAFWSILVEDEDGRVVYARNTEKLTIPASNRKLFSAAAILECLGDDRRLETEIWLDGGDLVIVGDGDPSLGAIRYERQDDFAGVVRLLQERGVTRVNDVIADVSRFDRRTFPGGWKHGNLGSSYAAPVDAIAWRENQVPEGGSVPDAALYSATALRETLLLYGIAVAGEPTVNIEPRNWAQRVGVIPSPFIAHLLTTVLKNSHNLYAEMLLKRTAAEEGVSEPASYAAALERESAFLASDVGLVAGTFRFVDGSGLAPDNLVTPRATVQMLRWMNHPRRRATWWALLAQPAGEGTLRNRLGELTDRLRGKTGTVAGVHALSGIIAIPDGRFRYFSIAVNHHLGSGEEALGVIDEIVRALAD